MDAAANPYLAYSLLLAAGLKGIEENYELPDETEQDVWALSNMERKALGIEALPQSLDHAIKKLEESELVAEVLGESVFNFVLANKRNEWADYRAQVTPYEIEQNLKTL
jgi:glutamine synthetase